MGMIKKILAAGIVGAAAGATWYYITKKPAAESSDFADDANCCGNACACKQDEPEQAQEGFVPESLSLRSKTLPIRLMGKMTIPLPKRKKNLFPKKRKPRSSSPR